jgi:hypothetical protein
MDSTEVHKTYFVFKLLLCNVEAPYWTLVSFAFLCVADFSTNYKCNFNENTADGNGAHVNFTAGLNLGEEFTDRFCSCAYGADAYCCCSSIQRRG